MKYWIEEFIPFAAILLMFSLVAFVVGGFVVEVVDSNNYSEKCVKECKSKGYMYEDSNMFREECTCRERRKVDLELKR